MHCYLWMVSELKGGRGAWEALSLYSLHCFVNSVLQSGDLQMYLFWNKHILFWFGLSLSRIGLVTCAGTDQCGETGCKCLRGEADLGSHCLSQEVELGRGKGISGVEWGDEQLPQELGREKPGNLLCAGNQTAPLNPLSNYSVDLPPAGVFPSSWSHLAAQSHHYHHYYFICYS